MSTFNTWEYDLRDIAPKLSHAKQRETELEQKKKNALKAWEQQPENAALITELKAAKEAREAVERTARAALSLYATASDETGDVVNGMYTIQQRTDVKVDDEAAVIEWIIRNAPVLAVSVLKVDAAALKTAIINNPILKTMPAEIKTVPGLAIQWKRLETLYPGTEDEPEYTPQEWAALKVWLGVDVKLVPHSLANTPAGAHEIQYVIGFDAVFHTPYAFVTDGPVNAATLAVIKDEAKLHEGSFELPITVHGTSCLISDGGSFIFHQVTPEMMQDAAETARKADQDARYNAYLLARKPTEWTDNEHGLVEGYLMSELKGEGQIGELRFKDFPALRISYIVNANRQEYVLVWGELVAEAYEAICRHTALHESTIVRVYSPYPIEGFKVDDVDTVLITNDDLLAAVAWAKSLKTDSAA